MPEPKPRQQLHRQLVFLLYVCATKLESLHEPIIFINSGNDCLFPHIKIFFLQI